MVSIGKVGYTLLIALTVAVVSACGGDDSNSVDTNEAATPETVNPDLPSSLSEFEYYQLEDAVDNDEVPRRIVPRVEPGDRIRFDDAGEATEALIDALADGDFRQADRVFASVPADWRRDLDDAVRDFRKTAFKSGNYADAYKALSYDHIDSNALWILDADYIEGRVKETGSGKPIPGTTITYEDRFPQSATTGAEGSFRILLPADRPVNLLVEHADYDAKRVFNNNAGAPISTQAMAGQSLEILLGTGYPKLTFRGRIVDAETGEPLAGLPVIAGFDPIDGATELNLQVVLGGFAGETDADGRFEIRNLPVNDIYVIAQAVLDSRLYALKQEKIQFVDGVDQVLRIPAHAVRLNVPLVVVGTVRDRVTGLPIENARVSAELWKSERTNKDGRFVIQLETGEEWQLTASHDAYRESAPQPFVSAKPQTIETEFLLDPITTGTILGTAINAATGEPIVNAVIEIAGQQVRTDGQGRFRAEEIESGEIQVSGAQSGFRADNQTLLLEALQTAEATLELDPITTGTVTGIVIDKESGAPLTGVAVSAGDVSGTTDDDGRFVLEEVEAGTLSVAGSKALFVPASTDVVLEAMASVDTQLVLEAITWGAIRGQVRDATSGQPLANATVRIGAIKIETDANGNYVAERVPAGEISIVAGLARYHDAQASAVLERDGEIEQVLELAPITTGTVFATIVDATSGEPIHGADVLIGQWRSVADSSGRVTAEEIPAGKVTVNADAPLYEPGSTEAVLDAAGEARLEIKLIPVTYGTIVGTVVNSVTGAPLANANIRVAGKTLRSDAQGNFRAERVTAGDVSVNAELFRYRSAQETIRLRRGTEDAVRLALEPITTGTVRGIVRNADGGQPLPGAIVTIGDLSARSNAEGRFEIENVPAGDSPVRASLKLFEPGESTVSLEAAGVADTELRLTPITYGTVSGTVVNAETGEPLENAVVSAGGQSGRTNAVGEFELQRVPAGDISVLASKAVHIDDAKAFLLDAGASEMVTLRLQPITWGIVTGVVTDAETGQPLANAEVVVGARGVRTDSAGSFRAEKVPAGSLRIAVKLPAYEEGSVTVELNADTERDVALALVPIKIGNIRGTVVDARTGEPIAQARVTAGRFAAETNAVGKFSFTAVSTGRNVVTARHPDYANGSATADVPPADTVDVTIRLELRREDVTNLEAELAKSGTIDLYGIYFDSGKDQFKPSSLPTLRAVLEVMKRAPERRFQIAGHTDSDGGDAFNQDLSERRARTVIRWLVDSGIDAGRIDGSGFGETRPAAPNDTESGKALNRRVQLSFAD